MDSNRPVETATLAGGCFWCLEAVFTQLRGVIVTGDAVDPAALVERISGFVSATWFMNSGFFTGGFGNGQNAEWAAAAQPATDDQSTRLVIPAIEAARTKTPPAIRSADRLEAPATGWPNRGRAARPMQL